jgi:hypothetical protein
VIQEDLVTLLSSSLSGRIYGGIGVQKPILPYVVYSRVVSLVENILAGNGNPPINNTRMQIDVWASSYSSAQSTAAAIRTLMLGWATQNVSNGEQDLYEEDTRLHRVLMDYSIWHYD